jgi:hypothetical protein
MYYYISYRFLEIKIEGGGNSRKREEEVER